MATDEKYLDNLLKSLTENEQQSRTMEDAAQPTKNEELFSGTLDNTDDDIDMDALADLLAEAMPKEEMPAEESTLDEEDLIKEADALTDESLQSEADAPIAEDWQSSLDDLLAQADAQVNEESNSDQTMDALGLFDNMDADLAEINGLLKNADNDNPVEDDMLALLESVKDDRTDDDKGSMGDAFDIFAENEDSVDDKEEFGQEKPQKKKLFSKDKSEKRKRKIKEKKGLKRKEQEEGASAEGLLDETENGKEQEMVKAKEKPGFFSRMLTYLTQEEDELSGASDENAEILQELKEEDKRKGKQEEKKKKKAEKKKGKKKAEAVLEGEEVADAEADTDKKKKKREKKKKEKKEKQSKDTATEKPVKILSRKNLLVLIAASATLIASICVLSAFLPEYADKQNARQAFYDGDYEEVYKLLYGKNLNSGDAVIYNRVRTVLTIERKLDSYKNNLAMGRKLEALDVLMQGVRCYQELEGVDTYGVRDEVDAVYQQICSILQNDYDITPEEALEINTYDNDTYTRKLYSVINGTEFTMPGEEVTEEELLPQDILPEEEEIISY